MGKIIYLIGNSVDSRQDLLDSRIASNDYSILHLVSTNGRVMELESDTRFWVKRRVNTLSGLIKDIFERDISHVRYPGFQPLPNSLIHLLIKKALERINSLPEGLSYFSGLLNDNTRDSDFIGVYRSISRFFSNLAENNFRDAFVNRLTDKIIRLDGKSPGLGESRYAMESDLAWLLGEYEEIKREINGYDQDDVRIAVHEFLRDGNRPHIMKKHDIIVLDGFIHFSRLEEDSLFFLARHTNEIWWLIDYDGDLKNPLDHFLTSSGSEYSITLKNRRDYNQPVAGIHEGYRVFTSLVSLMDRFKEAGLEYNIERANEVRFKIPCSGAPYSPCKDEYNENKSLKVKSFPDKTTEVRAIAGEIKRIIHDEKLDISRGLGNIRIIFPDLSTYSSIINEVFNEYGIPFSLTRGTPLVSHPLSNTFCNIFEVPLNNFNMEDIFRLFSSGLLQSGDSKEYHNALDQYKIHKDLLLQQDTQTLCRKILEKSYNDETEIKPDIGLIDRITRSCGLKSLAQILTIQSGNNKDLSRLKIFYEEKILHKKSKADKSRVEYYSFMFQLFLLSRRMEPFISLKKQRDPEGIEDAFFHILKRFDFSGNILKIHNVFRGRLSEPVTKMIRRDIKVYSHLLEVIRESTRELRMTQRLFNMKSNAEQLSLFYSIFLSRLNSSRVMDERNPNIIRISQW